MTQIKAKLRTDWHRESSRVTKNQSPVLPSSLKSPVIRQTEIPAIVNTAMSRSEFDYFSSKFHSTQIDKRNKKMLKL